MGIGQSGNCKPHLYKRVLCLSIITLQHSEEPDSEGIGNDGEKHMR